MNDGVSGPNRVGGRIADIAARISGLLDKMTETGGGTSGNNGDGANGQNSKRGPSIEVFSIADAKKELNALLTGASDANSTSSKAPKKAHLY